MSTKDKNREQRQQRKRKTRNANAHTRRAEYRANLRLERERLKAIPGDPPTVPPLSTEDHAFWVAHGINCLVSDFSTGEWKPLFEEIYTGRVPDITELTTRITAYCGEDTEDPRRVRTLTWALLPATTLPLLVLEAERRCALAQPEKDPAEEARRPHQPEVWGFLSSLFSF